MGLEYESTAFDARDPDRVARFWAGLLGRRVVQEEAGLLLPGAGRQLSLRFVPVAAVQVRPDAVHFHLTSADADDQRRQVREALDLGARHLDVGQRPEEGHVVLADPEGYPFCVIEPGNAYLAGTGRLGELTCAGAREVGLFWSRALGWPLVWDQDQETAIQSPLGGTKISWSGTPTVASPGRHHEHRLVAPAGSVPAETDRLTGLGARLLGTDDDGVRLTDPDGVPVRLRPLADGR